MPKRLGTTALSHFTYEGQGILRFGAGEWEWVDLWLDWINAIKGWSLETWKGRWTRWWSPLWTKVVWLEWGKSLHSSQTILVSTHNPDSQRRWVHPTAIQICPVCGLDIYCGVLSVGLTLWLMFVELSGYTWKKSGLVKPNQTLADLLEARCLVANPIWALNPRVFQCLCFWF